MKVAERLLSLLESTYLSRQAEKRTKLEQMLRGVGLPKRVSNRDGQEFNVVTKVLVSGEVTSIGARDIRKRSTAKQDSISFFVEYPNYDKSGEWSRFAGKIYTKAKVNEPKNASEIKNAFDKMLKRSNLSVVS